MLEHLHLKNVGPAPEMAMELAPRLNLITGDDGWDIKGAGTLVTSRSAPWSPA
jgi:hypothetical protein